MRHQHRAVCGVLSRLIGTPGAARRGRALYLGQGNGLEEGPNSRWRRPPIRCLKSGGNPVRMKLALTSLAVLAALLQSPDLQAQTWPQKPIMFVVPFAPGGGTDAFARPMAAQLDQQLGQRVLIENKAGAGGTLGASYASKQAADGYTFLVGAAHHTIAPSIYPRLDYDFEKDFVPVIMLAQPPHVVSVNPGKIQAKTLKEFIAYTQNNQV